MNILKTGMLVLLAAAALTSATATAFGITDVPPDKVGIVVQSYITFDDATKVVSNVNQSQTWDVTAKLPGSKKSTGGVLKADKSSDAIYAWLRSDHEHVAAVKDFLKEKAPSLALTDFVFGDDTGLRESAILILNIK